MEERRGLNHFLRVYIAFGGREASKKYIYTVSVSVFVSVDVVLCLKGSDDDDVHNHLAISDLVSIRWIWKVWILVNLYSGKVFVLWLFREKEGGLQVVEVEGEVEEVHVDRSEKIPSQGGGLLAGHLPSKLPLILTENSRPAALLKFIFVFVFVLCYFRLDVYSAILFYQLWWWPLWMMSKHCERHIGPSGPAVVEYFYWRRIVLWKFRIYYVIFSVQMLKSSMKMWKTSAK